MTYDPNKPFSGHNADPIEVTVYVLEERKLSIRVTEDDPNDEETESFFLPLSQIMEVAREGDLAVLAIPQWLAEEKGLV